jgi:acetylornithine deacetylase
MAITSPSTDRSVRIAGRIPALLERLVGFDTTSRESNLALISWVEAYLGSFSIQSRRIPDSTGAKANLLARLGPEIDGGIVLSGHTDVVPVDGQPWDTDPFCLTLKEDQRYYGRGTCDMKGFLAQALATVPEWADNPPSKPVYLAFSYDEEIGCLGAPSLISSLMAEDHRPDLVIVGEPTSMEVVCGHKGIANFLVTLTGHEAHSSQPHQGVSAIMAAIPLLGALHRLAADLESHAEEGSIFSPPYPTLTIGVIEGGTAHNILARHCSFCFDLRCPPGIDPEAVLSEFLALIDDTDRDMKRRMPQTGVQLERRSLVPPLAPEKHGMAEELARRLTGDNGPSRAVGFAAEAGQFQMAGLSTIICGPGSIDQAHQPNEYVDASQLERAAGFMSRLFDELA